MATFGYTTAGTAGTTSIENAIRGSQFTTPAGGPWSVDQISAYYNPTAAHTSKCAIYTAGGALVALSETSVITGVSGAAFRNFTFPGSKPVLAGNTPYVLVCWAQATTGTNVFHFDAGVSGDGKSVAATYAASYPATLTLGTGPNKYSIYATIHLEVIYAGVTAVATAVAASLVYSAAVPAAIPPDVWGGDQWGGGVWGGPLPAVFAGALVIQTSQAAAFQYSRAAVLTGSVILTVGPVSSGGAWGDDTWGGQWGGQAPSTEYARNSGVAGAVTVVTVASATRAYNRNAQLQGGVTTAAAVAGALQYAHAQAVLAGAVVLAAVPAGTGSYARNSVISGSVAVAAAVSGTLAYNRNGSLQGTAGVTASVASSLLQHASHRTLAAGVILSAGTAGSAQYARNAALAASASVIVAAAATELSYRSAVASGISGNIATAVIPAGAADFTRNASIAGTGAWILSTGAALEFDDAALSHLLSSSVLLGTVISATAEYNSHHETGGQTAVITLLAASQLAYNRNASLAASGTTALSVLAGFAFEPAAAGQSLSGSILLATGITGAAAYNSHPSVAGQITVLTQFAAGLAATRHGLINGSVMVLLGVNGSASAEGFEPPIPLRLHVVPSRRPFVHSVRPRMRLDG